MGTIAYVVDTCGAAAPHLQDTSAGKFKLCIETNTSGVSRGLSQICWRALIRGYRSLLQSLAPAHRPVPSTSQRQLRICAQTDRGRDTTGLGQSQQGFLFAPCRLGAEITGVGDVPSEAESHH